MSENQIASQLVQYPWDLKWRKKIARRKTLQILFLILIFVDCLVFFLSYPHIKYEICEANFCYSFHVDCFILICVQNCLKTISWNLMNVDYQLTQTSSFKSWHLYFWSTVSCNWHINWVSFIYVHMFTK